MSTSPPPRVSVALATYNGEKYLQEQLESLLSQTYPPFELVVSDDGSVDRTVALVELFASEAPFRVRLSQNRKRLGFADNFLLAARSCTGDLVAFCDQDDVWLRQKLEHCVGVFTSPSVQLVIHDVEVVDEDLNPQPRIFPEPIRSRYASTPEEADPWFLAHGFAMVFRAHLKEFDCTSRPSARGSKDTRMAHDEWIYFLATALGTTEFLPDRLALYRQHGSNVAGATLADVDAPGSRQGRRGSTLRVSRAGLCRRQATLAAEYGNFADAVSRNHPQYREEFARAAVRYRRTARIQQIRATLYEEAASIPDRMQAFILLIALSAYKRRRSGGLGWQSFLKDFLVSLLGIR